MHHHQFHTIDFGKEPAETGYGQRAIVGGGYVSTAALTARFNPPAQSFRFPCVRLHPKPGTALLSLNALNWRCHCSGLLQLEHLEPRSSIFMSSFLPTQDLLFMRTTSITGFTVVDRNTDESECPEEVYQDVKKNHLVTSTEGCRSTISETALVGTHTA